EVLPETVLEANKDIGKPAKDAGFTIKDGKPEVVPSETGIGIKAKELTTVVTEVIKGDNDDPEVTLASVEPDFTTKDAKKADVSETVSEFSTGYSSEDRKSTRLNSSHVSISYAVFCLKQQ